MITNNDDVVEKDFKIELNDPNIHRLKHKLFVREIISSSSSLHSSNHDDDDESTNSKSSLDNTGELDADENKPYVMIVLHGGPGLSDSSECYPGLKHLIGHNGLSDMGCDDDNDSREEKDLQPLPSKPSRLSTSNMIHSMIFYEQLGCGQSDKPPLPAIVAGVEDPKNLAGPTLYSLSYYVYELDQVVGYVKSKYPANEYVL